MGKTVFNPPTLCRPFGIFSNVALADQGRTCFISGQVSIDAKGNTVGKEDIRLQTRQVLRNIRAALEAVGGAWEDIACINVFLVNMEHLQGRSRGEGRILEWRLSGQHPGAGGAAWSIPTI